MIPKELSLENISKVYSSISKYINHTPMIKGDKYIDDFFNTKLYFKYEFLQKSGSFKLRGAINNILSLNKKQLKNGITAVSAGNHAIASSYVANLFNLKNKIFLYETSNKFRVQTCKKLNANIEFTNVENAFKNVIKAEKEGYTFIHPFDGPCTLQGTATLGFEIYKQFNDFDNIIISIGGGGLISGVGACIKQLNPKCKIIGVEPEGAKGMTESLMKGSPLNKVKVNSIADSLCAPLHMDYSFSVAKNVIDEIVTVDDEQMIQAMKFAYENFKLFLEPACVCGIAALNNKFNGKFKNQNTLMLLCGSSIDYKTWQKYFI